MRLQGSDLSVRISRVAPVVIGATVAAAAVLRDLVTDDRAAEAADDRSAAAVRDRIAEQRSADAADDGAGVRAAPARCARSGGPGDERQGDKSCKGG